MNELNSNMTNPMFITPDEQQIAVLGQSYLRSMVTGGGLATGTCILTSKRLYFKGTCFTSNGKGFSKSSEDSIVDIKDITASGFSVSSNIAYFIFALVAVIFSITSIVDGIDSNDYYRSQWGMSGQGDTQIVIGIIGIIIALLAVFLFFVRRHKLYVISFAGGKLAFKASSYSTVELSNFQRMLRLVKDGYTYNPTWVQILEKNPEQKKAAN